MGTITGSFGISTSNQYVNGVLEWSSTTNTAGNYSTVSFTLKFHRNNVSSWDTYGTGSWDVWVAGAHKPSGSKSFTYPSNNAWVTVHSGSVDVSHSADGTRQINIEVDGWTDVHDVYYAISSPWLETIPRASTVSSGVSWTAGVDNLGVTINRASTGFTHKLELFVQHTYDSNYDKIGERTNIGDSTTWVFTEAEIKAIYTTNNGYENRPVILRTRTYSGGTQIGDYKDKTGTVYAIPTGTATMDGDNRWAIGTSLPITINNFRSGFQYDLIFTVSSFTKTFSNVTSSSYTMSFTSGEVTSIYGQTPNSNEITGNVVVRTKYQGVYTEDGAPVSNSTNFVAVVTNSKPTFGTGYTYKDTNTTTNTVKGAGNEAYIIQNKSNLVIEIPVSAKATAVNGATMKTYEATVNGVPKPATWSDTATVSFDFGTVNASSNITVQVKAIDSRGNSTTTSKTILIVPYWEPIVTAGAERANGFEASTTISVSGNIAPLNVNGAVKNDIATGVVEYRYKENPSGSWSSWADFTFTESAATTNYTYSATNKTLTLDNLKSYTVEVRVSDKLTTTTVSRQVPVGQPLLFFDSAKKSIGFGKFPDETNTVETANPIIIGRTGEGAELLRFATERGWKFAQVGTGSQTALALQSLTESKSFRIMNSNGEIAANFFAETGNNSTSFFGSMSLNGDSITPNSGRSLPGNNMDTCYEVGRYNFNSSTVGRPANYGVVDVLVSSGGTYNGSSNWIWQIAYTTDSSTRIWIRNRVNAGSWNSWEEIMKRITPTYVPVTLMNGWVNAYSEPAGYSVSQEGICIVQGRIKNGTTTGGTQICTLPQPVHPQYFAGRGCNIYLNSFGTCTIYPNNNSDVGFDGFVYRIK